MIYTFDKKAQVGQQLIQIDSKAQYGCFEHQELGDEGPGGSLTFDDDKFLIDYDGVYELPRNVIKAIRQLGYIVGPDFESEPKGVIMSEVTEFTPKAVRRILEREIESLRRSSDRLARNGALIAASNDDLKRRGMSHALFVLSKEVGI
jgi:hypothetical protein